MSGSSSTSALSRRNVVAVMYSHNTRRLLVPTGNVKMGSVAHAVPASRAGPADPLGEGAAEATVSAAAWPLVASAASRKLRVLGRAGGVRHDRDAPFLYSAPRLLTRSRSWSGDGQAESR